MGDFFYSIAEAVMPRLWVALLVLAILAIGLIAFVVWIVKRSKRRQQAPVEQSWPAEILAGLSLDRSFSKAKRWLRLRVGGSGYLYKVPWYLMIGREGAGKSSALQGTGMLLPQAPRQRVRPGAACTWWFMDRGVVLDVGGSLVTAGEPGWFRSDNWRRLLRLLQKYRPTRPLDGVVVAIPAEDLLSSDAESAAALRETIARIHDRLWQGQSRIGMRWPIYVVVTKCDRVAGFSATARELPARLADAILGWSSPYSTDTAYASGWVDEMFDDLGRNLFRLQAELMASRQELDDPDGVFEFPARFAQLKGPLGGCLDEIFSQSPYRESFFLRGVYFSGTAEEAKPFAEEARQEPTLEAAPSHRRTGALFLRDLFRDKILAEHDIAHPLRRSHWQRNRAVITAQATFAVLLLAGAAAVWNDYTQLSEAAAGLPKITGDIKRMRTQLRDWSEDLARFRDTGMWSESLAEKKPRPIQLAQAGDITRSGFLLARATPRGDGPDDVAALDCNAPVELTAQEWAMFRQRRLLAEAGQLLADMSTIHTSTYEGPGLPFSYFSDLRRRVRWASLVGFSEAVFPAICWELSFRTNALVKFGTLDRTSEMLPSVTPEFDDLRRFVKQYREHSENVRRYNRLRRLVLDERDPPSEAEGYEFMALMNYLLGADTLSEQLEKARATNLELRRVPLEIQKRTTFEGFGDYVESQFRTVEPRTEAAAKRVNVLAGSLLDALVQASGRADTGPAVTTAATRETLSLDFQVLEETLDRFAGNVDLADWDQDLVKAIPANARLVWSPRRLADAVEATERYHHSVIAEFNEHPAALRQPLLLLSTRRFEARLRYILATAQIFEPRTESLAEPFDEEQVKGSVQNFNQVSELFTQLLARLKLLEFTRTQRDLSTLIAYTAMTTLESVDRLRDGLYAPVPGLYTWEGEPGLAFDAFRVADAEDLGAYLLLQRERVRLLAREYARPVLSYLARAGLTTDDESVMFRWRRTLAALEDYEALVPENPISELERFIFAEMNGITIENCLSRQRSAVAASNAGDLFLARLSEIEKMVAQRCRRVVLDRFTASYDQLARLFNRHLSGRYPFVKDSGDGSFAWLSAVDADPETVRSVYAKLDSLPQQVRDLLSGAIVLPEIRPDILAFAAEFSRARGVMAPWIEHVPGAPPATLDLAVDFRVNRLREVGGNQIMEWSLDAGGRSLRPGVEVQRTTWGFGEPAALQLRWATGSAYKPAANPARPDLVVHSARAKFNYEGGWSLLKMIQANRPLPELAGSATPITATTLGFAVPVEPRELPVPPQGAIAVSEAKVFVDLSILGPPDESGARKALRIPRFPSRAPDLFLSQN